MSRTRVPREPIVVPTSEPNAVPCWPPSLMTYRGTTESLSLATNSLFSLTCTTTSLPDHRHQTSSALSLWRAPSLLHLLRKPASHSPSHVPAFAPAGALDEELPHAATMLASATGRSTHVPT